MKILKILIPVILLVTIVIVLFFYISNRAADNNDVFIDQDGLKYTSIAKPDGFYFYKDKKWEKEFIKGVNIGVGIPGYFPGELAITKEDYLRWFQYIGEMNANVIRVYTTQKPIFYDALLEYNKSHKPLYVMHGVWVNEEDIINLSDIFASDEKIVKDTFKESCQIIDVLHGACTIEPKSGYASGVYTSDISQYVVGWILGIEWDPTMVKMTNDNNPNHSSFTGTYLYTENASPFEVFLCEIGENAISYEMSKYKMQRPLSFVNWVTTDPLKHPNEPMDNEDLVNINTEHIKTLPAFKTGYFASYHIYPYYPDSLNYQKEYKEFVDIDGKIDSYKAYLRELKKFHTVPVLVAEFGIPAARGMAHVNLAMGFNQGNVSEQSQGEMVKKMLQDIHDEGYAGGLVFAWQDEWFKRTWNTVDFDLPERRPYWSNPQTNEQEFGLLAFDPGKNESVCYVDGDVDEWVGTSPIINNDKMKLYMKSDEKYAYFMVDAADYNFDKDTLLIPIDTIPDQGNSSYAKYNASFSRPADFLITINKKDNSRILVDAYYDSYYFMYSKQTKYLPLVPEYEIKGNGLFNPMYLFLNRRLYLPLEKKLIPFSNYETGALKYGDANPKHSEFNSLSDYCYKNGKLEIRIPWQLLNLMDPSTKMAMGDLYKNKMIKAQKITGMYAGAAIDNPTSTAAIEMNEYSWRDWQIPTYHERLKPSYYILKDAFLEIK